MFKKILIFAFCICLLTACSDSSNSAGESSKSDSSIVSTTTTETTTVSTTNTSAETTALKPADESLWKNAKFVAIDGLSFPIPNGYSVDVGSGNQSKNYIRANHGKYKIKCLNKLEAITDDFLKSDSQLVSKEIINVNSIDFGVVYTNSGAHIYVNGHTSTFMIKFEGSFTNGDYNEYRKLTTLKPYNETTETTTVTTTTVATTTSARNVSVEFENALKDAYSYLRSSSFSKEGLIHQLEYEKYSKAAAEYAVNNCSANWNEQALECAKSYLRGSGFSKKGLLKQLVFEKFTESEAAYGVSNCGANWNEQAVKTAQSYLQNSSFSKQELINQLVYEGFTQAEAQYGADVAYK